MKKKVAFLFAVFVICSTIYSTPNLASNLGISTAAAKKAIDIIDMGDDIVTIVSLIAIVTGACAVSGGIALVAKRMIKSVGKKAAAAW